MLSIEVNIEILINRRIIMVEYIKEEEQQIRINNENN